MIDAPSIDYKIAFEELKTLNKVFAGHHDWTLPTLNPTQFWVEEVETGSRDVIVHGIQTGLNYLSTRSGTSSLGYQYSACLPVTPVERTVVTWVKS
jgi:hypothetical protein